METGRPCDKRFGKTILRAGLVYLTMSSSWQLNKTYAHGEPRVKLKIAKKYIE